MTQKHTNRLAQEKSPYLLQHAHNPVDWYPWGIEAFEKSKKENKPIFLSIGYSTCHWCHVMERESFENEATAKYMNENFVNIKVDREERPDVDHIYMTAVQAMTGGGGWPLSAFLSPDLKPFFGGTYFPPDRRWGRPSFLDVLSEINRLWHEDKQKVADWGAQIYQAMNEIRVSEKSHELNEEVLKPFFHRSHQMFDAVHGGFGGAPKFPRSESLSLLLRIHARTGNQEALTMVTTTLEHLARGGIYDHVGGGFHRYSTDAKWLVPHFEKMLYDNALLAKTYLEAFQVTKNPIFADVARETLDYVLRDMTSTEGGFYSAEDADSEGVEGKFYVWSEDELQKSLTSLEFAEVKKVFQTSESGNFEGENILHMNQETSWKIRYEETLQTALQKLWKLRETRIHPYKDDKILTSWNALMISAMSFASQVLNDKKYLEAAQKSARFILEKLYDEKTLKRRYREGEARFDGSLDDYSFFIQALLDLYESDFDETWFTAAIQLQKQSDALFWDAKHGGYFLTDEHDPSIIARMKEIYDGAVPSGNSIAALNLLRLYAFTHEENYETKYRSLVRYFSEFATRNPQAVPAFLMAVDFATDSKEIVVAGDSSHSLTKEIFQSFVPNKVLAFSKENSAIPLTHGKTSLKNLPTLYICEGHACKEPLTDLKKITEALNQKKSYEIQ